LRWRKEADFRVPVRTFKIFRTALRRRQQKILVVANFSQLELSVMAAIAQDTKMQEAYRNGLDWISMRSQLAACSASISAHSMPRIQRRSGPPKKPRL
jgi:DNA polymerase I-like protein with 3'-5' exonuclease and polymerase domains